MRHKPATHRARMIELLYAAEHWGELATGPEITGEECRVVPIDRPAEGVGCIEAPRETPSHHDNCPSLTRGAWPV